MTQAPQVQSLKVTVRALSDGIEVLSFTPHAVSVALDRLDEAQVRVAVDSGVVPNGLEIGTPQLSAQRGHRQRPARACSTGSTGRWRRCASTRRGSTAAARSTSSRSTSTAAGSSRWSWTRRPCASRSTSAPSRRAETVPIRPLVTGAPAAGFEVGTVTAEPSVVTLRGAPEVLAAIGEILTEPISLAGSDATLRATGTLVLPDGARLADPAASEPTIVVQIRETVGTRTLVLGVVCSGAPSGSACLPRIGQVAATVSGTVSDLDALDPADLTRGARRGGAGTGRPPRPADRGAARRGDAGHPVADLGDGDDRPAGDAGALMGRLFGTDGIRGVANVDLTPNLAYDLGRAVGHCSRHSGGAWSSARTPVGRATCWSPPSRPGLASVGADAIQLGVVTTPCLAHAAASGEFAAGIMVSASHNPPDDNGLKVALRRPEDRRRGRGGARAAHLPGRVAARRAERADRAQSRMTRGRSSRTAALLVAEAGDLLRGMRIGDRLRQRLGRGDRARPVARAGRGGDGPRRSPGRDEHQPRVAARPHPQALAAAVLAGGLEMGMAFDGDADRLIAVDEAGDDRGRRRGDGDLRPRAAGRGHAAERDPGDDR